MNKRKEKENIFLKRRIKKESINNQYEESSKKKSSLRNKVEKKY